MQGLSLSGGAVQGEPCDRRISVDVSWFRKGLAFLLDYTGVCVFGGVVLAAGVPLLG
jgi:hypothetical protein